MFGQRKVEVKQVQQTKIEENTKKSLISSERARNIEMIMHRRKLNLAKLRKACFTFDEEYLDYGMVMSLIEVHPIHSEI